MQTAQNQTDLATHWGFCATSTEERNSYSRSDSSSTIVISIDRIRFDAAKGGSAGAGRFHVTILKFSSARVTAT
jgi:hypothetical protein